MILALLTNMIVLVLMIVLVKMIGLGTMIALFMMIVPLVIIFLLNMMVPSAKSPPILASKKLPLYAKPLVPNALVETNLLLLHLPMHLYHIKKNVIIHNMTRNIETMVVVAIILLEVVTKEMMGDMIAIQKMKGEEEEIEMMREILDMKSVVEEDLHRQMIAMVRVILEKIREIIVVQGSIVMAVII